MWRLNGTEQLRWVWNGATFGYLLLGLNFAEIANLAKLHFVEWQVAGVAEWNIAWGLCSVENEPLLLWGAEVGEMNGSVM